MKALLLSAGYGSRLGQITKTKPKCMVDVGGKPMVIRWLEKLEEIECGEVLINTHYMSDQVREGTKKWREERQNLSLIHEERLLGTAKTLIQNKNFFLGETGLLIHTDNYMEESLTNLIKAHYERPAGCIMTALSFETSDPKNCGILETDKRGIMVRYVEKPMEPDGNLANGAVFVFENQLFEHIEKYCKNAADFSKDVLPTMIGKVQTYKTVNMFLDIGTPEKLKKAQKYVVEINSEEIND